MPSHRYIAFLRGINVGGHRVKMDLLRDLFLAMKLKNVSTFIASGNVIFESPDTDTAALERKIETKLEAALGFEAQTFLRTALEVEDVLSVRPFATEDHETAGHTVHIGFLREALPAAERNAIKSFATAMDAFHVRDRHLYWLCRGKTTDSLVKWPAVTRAVKTASTMRNVTSLRKLLENLQADKSG